jgi:peptidoglycan/LPS O-acetylase OafA/YrhL
LYFGAGAVLPGTGTPGGVVVHVVAAMIAGILGGVLSYLVLERPLLAAGHRLTGRRALSRRSVEIELHP